MNELAPLAKLENRIKLLVDELKVAREHTTEKSDNSVETSNKLGRIEEKIKNLIQMIKETL